MLRGFNYFLALISPSQHIADVDLAHPCGLRHIFLTDSPSLESPLEPC